MGEKDPISGASSRKKRTTFGSFRAAAGSAVGLLRNPERPASFDFLFWSILALTYAFHIFAPEIPLREFGLAPMTLVCAVLVAVWLALPWNHSATRLRKLLSPAFVVAATAMLLASDLIWALGFYPIAFANAVFLFGLRRGAVYSAATLLVLFVIALFRSASTPGGTSPEIVVQRWALISLLTVVCVGLSSAVMEARRGRERTQDLLEDLESAHAELGRYAARVRELTLSAERARMAREIHDSVGHHLTAVKLQAEAALKTAEKRPEKAREQMERARDLAAEAYEEVRRSVRALGPPSLGEGSGAGALRALVRSFDGTGFEVHLRIEGEERELPEETELVLYRALQEGLTNAARHSRARRVEALLSYEDAWVRLAVSDDGRGTPEEPRTGGFGLISLGERVGEMGGALSAGDAPGGGFVLEIGLPSGTSPEATP